jgi:Bacterial Ig-like domain
MESRRNHLYFIMAMIISVSFMGGCSSSDDPVTPGDNPPVVTDTIAPLVTGFDPETGTINIPTDAVLQVEFSEPMLTSTATGNITLTAGTVSLLEWDDDSMVLEISLGGLTESQSVTLTVGEGLTDLAGNNLPQAFSTQFFTHSSVPVMMEVDFHADPLAVPCTVRPAMQFSEGMDLLSVYNATTISDGSKTVPQYQIGTVMGDYSHVTIKFLSPLDAETTYSVEISTDAVTQEGTNLSAPVNFSFTTTQEVDTTAPTLVSTVPAQGSVSPRTLDRVILNFSEPVDPTRVDPDTLSAFFHFFSQAEPVWNEAGDQMTVYLSGTLPAGVDFFAGFEDEAFYDWANNGNSEPVSVRFSIEGEADLFPVRADLGWVYEFDGEGADDQGTWNDEGFFLTVFDPGTGNNFDRISNVELDGEFSVPDEHWFMSEDSGGNITMRGFEENEGNVMFSPALNYLPNPVPNQWEGQAQMTQNGETAWIHFSGETVEPARDVRWRYVDGAWVVMENVINIRLVHTLSTDEAGTNVISEGTEEFMVCPGLGFVGWESEEFEYEEGIQVEEYYYEAYLEQVALREAFE